MKRKILSLALSGAMLLSVAACAFLDPNAQVEAVKSCSPGAWWWVWTLCGRMPPVWTGS